jgi:hypothetical protein
MTSWATKSPVVTKEVELPRVVAQGHGTDDPLWVERIDELLAIRQLEDDWDGQGTPAPAIDVVDSALILALLLKREGFAAPNLVTQGLSGGVHFDWLPHDGRYVELQITAPQHGFIYVHTPGQPVKEYTLTGLGHEIVS